MKKKTKGFTLVELLVVIAILAILATVSVVGYLAFTSKAKQSADEQAVTQMNTVLAGEGVTNKPADVEEAKDMLEAAGFNVEDYTPLYSNYIFYYDSSEYKVLIYDQEEQKVTYPEDLVEKYAEYIDGRKSSNWYILNDKTYENVTFEQLGVTDLVSAINKATSYQTIVLDSDQTLAKTSLNEKFMPVNSELSANIDLNGHTLICDFEQDLIIGDNTNVKFSNGRIQAKEYEYLDKNNNTVKTSTCISINDGASLTLDNVTFNSPLDTAILPYGSASEVNIYNSNISANVYGITTNASGDLSWDVIVNVENSTIASVNGPAVLVNVPGNYNFKNCTIEGNGQGVVVRGGIATIENSVIKEFGSNTMGDSDPEFSKWNDYPFYGGKWASGNMLQFGGLIVGDWSNQYNYNASVTLVNTSVYMNDDWVQLPVVYLSQDSDCTTILTYDDNCKFYKNNTDITPETAIIVNSVQSLDDLPRGNIIVNGVAKNN